jgi:hypothetical protein
MSPGDKLLLRPDERISGPGEHLRAGGTSEVFTVETNTDRQEHPTAEELSRFLSGTATREERRRVAVHMLRGCDTCALFIQELFRPEPPPEDAYEEVLLKFIRQLEQDPALSAVR